MLRAGRFFQPRRFARRWRLSAQQGMKASGVLSMQNARGKCKSNLSMFSTFTTSSLPPPPASSSQPNIISWTRQELIKYKGEQESEQGSLKLPVVVMKFGGSSLGNADAVHRSCQIAADHYARGDNVNVVVSAMYGVTNKLQDVCHAAAKGDMDTVAALRESLRLYHIAEAEALLMDDEYLCGRVRNTIHRILEQYLDSYVAKIREAKGFPEGSNWFECVSSLGERLSVPLVCAVLSTHNIATSEVYTDDLIIRSSDLNENVALSGVRMDITRENLRDRLLPLLSQGIVPVVSGFIAGNEKGDVVTLGRGGSDLTSTLVAAAVDARCVFLWKVECDTNEDGFMKGWKSLREQHTWTGIRSIDPTKVKESEIVTRLSYEEATELTHFGKKVLHASTMAPVTQQQIEIYVRNTNLPSHPGTAIGVVDLENVPSNQNNNNKNGDNNNGINSSNHINNTTDSDNEEEGGSLIRAITTISLPQYQTLHQGKVRAALKSLFDHASVQELSILSLIGANLARYPNLFHTCKQAVTNAGVEVIELPNELRRAIGSENNISLVLPTQQIDAASDILHKRFIAGAKLAAQQQLQALQTNNNNNNNNNNNENNNNSNNDNDNNIGSNRSHNQDGEFLWKAQTL